MSLKTDNMSASERTIIYIVLILLLLLSPLTDIWAAIDAPWYSPYLVWAVAIFLSWLLQRNLKHHDL